MPFKNIVDTCANNINNMITLYTGSWTILSFSFSSAATIAVLDLVLQGTDLRKLIVPISIYCVGLITYTMFVLFDTITGVRAAKIISLEPSS